MAEKQCVRCWVVKPLDEFSVSSKGSLGRHSYCKPCFKVYGTAWRASNPRRVRENTLRLRYGLTPSQLTSLEERAGGSCECCGMPFRRTPSVDHDHETGAVRGLVCQRCNLAIGWIESEGILDLARKYLSR